MTNEQKSNELANYFAGENDYKESAAYSSAMEMAQWKDEQYRQKLEMILNAPNEMIRIELLTKLINNKL